MDPQLSLLAPLATPGTVRIWSALDEATRSEVVHRLAHLIARAAIPTNPHLIPDSQEPSHE